MNTLLPTATPARLRFALTEPAALRSWWDPDAEVIGGRLSPGLDAPTLGVRTDTTGVTWQGAAIRARFDLTAGTAVLETSGVPSDERADLEAGWALALAALGWFLEPASAFAGATDGGPAVSWLRLEVPVALSYGDAWSRISGPEGLASVDSTGAEGGAPMTVRIAGVRYPARLVCRLPPRAVALVVDEIGHGGALLRLQIGPGDSVNVAHLDLLVRGTPPDGWEPWLAQRFGMSWVTQLGEEG